MRQLAFPNYGVFEVDPWSARFVVSAAAAVREAMGRPPAAGRGPFNLRDVEAPESSPTGAWRRRFGPKYAAENARAIRAVYADLALRHGERREPVVLTQDWLCGLHARLTAASPGRAEPGRIRHVPVRVGTYTPPSAADLPRLLGDLQEMVRIAPESLLDRFDGDTIAASLTRAFLAHAAVNKLHPFTDGNGRTARAVEFALLLDAGLPPWLAERSLMAHTGTRHEYCARLRSIVDVGPVPFLVYASRGLSRELGGPVLLGAELPSRRDLLRAGYSLMELIAVVTILGTVAAIVLPRVAGGIQVARLRVEQLNVRQIRNAIDRQKLLSDVWPSALDTASNTASSPANPLFETVLGVGDTSGQWAKLSSTTYSGPTGTVYQYDSGAGTFLASSGGGGGGTTGTTGGGGNTSTET